MQYKIVFHEENERSYKFDYDGFIGNPEIDTENFETKYNEVVVRIADNKYNYDIFQSFREDNSVQILSVLGDPTASQGYVTTNGETLTPGDSLWVNDECLTVDSLFSGFTYLCNRAQNGTRAMVHVVDTTQDPYLIGFVNGRNSPIGLEATIYDTNDNIVYRGYVTGLSTSGAGVAISLDSILNKLDSEYFVPWNSSYVESISDLIYNVGGFNQLLDLNAISLEGLRVNQSVNTDLGYTVNLAEVLNDLLKINLAFISIDPVSGKYNITALEGFSTFNTALDSKTISGSQLLSGGYKADLNGLFTAIKLTYSIEALDEYGNFTKETEERTYTKTASSLSGNYKSKVMELTLEGLTINRDVEEATAEAITAKFLDVFGLVLGTLDVNVSPYNLNIEIGSYYNIPLQYRLFTTIPREDLVLLCINKSGNMAQFLVLEGLQFYPVIPLIPCSLSYTAEQRVNFAQADFEKLCVLRTRDTYSDIEDYAMLDGTTYFLAGDYVELYDRENNYLGTEQISGAGTSTYFIITGTYSDQPAFFTYVDKDDVNRTTQQSKFLYNAEGKA